MLPAGAWIVVAGVGFLALAVTLGARDARRRAMGRLGDGARAPAAPPLMPSDWVAIGASVASAVVFGYVALGAGAPLALDVAFVASAALALASVEATLIPILRDAAKNAAVIKKGDTLVVLGSITLFSVASLAFVDSISLRVAAGASVSSAGVVLLGVARRGDSRAAASSAP